MFNYAKDISLLCHDIIINYLNNFNIAVDCTLGNGHDTDFLCEHFLKVYAFDIQKLAVDIYKEKAKKNAMLINDSHENILKYIKEDKVDCIIYNLGFLPGGNKNITTLATSTLNSLKYALNILNSKGIIVICLYIGHSEGIREKEVLMPFLKKLDKSKYGVVSHEFINRSENAPILLIIEKK